MMSKRSESVQSGPPTIWPLVMFQALRMMLRSVLLVTLSMPPGVTRTDDGPPSLLTLTDETSNVGACASEGPAAARAAMIASAPVFIRRLLRMARREVHR